MPNLRLAAFSEEQAACDQPRKLLSVEGTGSAQCTPYTHKLRTQAHFMVRQNSAHQMVYTSGLNKLYKHLGQASGSTLAQSSRREATSTELPEAHCWAVQTRPLLKAESSWLKWKPGHETNQKPKNLRGWLGTAKMCFARPEPT